MSDQISDLLTLPVIVFLIALFVLFLLWAFRMLIYNASNNEMNIQAVKFLDALNSYVAENGGFSDQGSGSFADYVAEYTEQKPFKNPIYVKITAYNYKDTQALGSNASIVSSGTHNNYCSGFWLDTSDNSSTAIHTALGGTVLDGANGNVLAINEGTGVMGEGWTYVIEVTPMYCPVKKISNSSSDVDVCSSTDGLMNTTKYFTFRDEFGKDGEVYYKGKTLSVSGMITNYTKSTKKTA